MMNYVTEDGQVLWDEVVTFNSSKDRPKRLKTPKVEKLADDA